MPQSTLSRARILELLPRPLADSRFDELLFRSKAEVEVRDGDELTLSVTPDRLDLLSEGGLALYLAGAAGMDSGLAPIATAPRSPSLHILADQSVGKLRPAIAALIVTAPTPKGLDQGLLDEAIRFQELLHATIGRDRSAASIGIYPLRQVVGPVRYALEPIARVAFTPLDGDSEVTAETFFSQHPLAAQYGALGRENDRCLTLRDAGGTILSLPPVLNARGSGEARVGDRELLLEATGTRARTVSEILGLQLLVFAARGYGVRPVRIRGPGAKRSDGRALCRPRTVPLPGKLLNAVAGAPISTRTVQRLAGMARLGCAPAAGGWKVQASPWRPDLLGPIDAVEEIVLAAGIRQEDAHRAPSSTLGGRRPEVSFRRRFLPLLLGLGYQPLYHPVLTSTASVDRLPELRAVRLANPPSAEYGALRPNLLVPLLAALAANVRYGYPQKLCEGGPVIILDSEAESGARTDYHVAAVTAGDRVGFADVAALEEYLLRSMGLVGVRETAELPGIIPGRAAQVRLAGAIIGELGEVHPRILTELKIGVPVAWFELDLSALWPLVRPTAAPAR